MDFLLHACDLDTVRHWLARGAVAGGVVTAREAPAGFGVDTDTLARLAELYAPRPLMVDMPVGALDTTTLPEDVRKVCGVSDSAVVRLPLLNATGEDLLEIVHGLASAGQPVGVSGCTSVGQVMLAWKAGAGQAGVAWGRILDAGGDPLRVVAGCVQWGGLRNVDQCIVVEDVRQVGDIYEALRSGAEAVIVAPELLRGLVHHAERAPAC